MSCRLHAPQRGGERRGRDERENEAGVVGPESECPNVFQITSEAQQRAYYEAGRFRKCPRISLHMVSMPDPHSPRSLKVIVRA